jgi:hypothetical protein
VIRKLDARKKNYPSIVEKIDSNLVKFVRIGFNFGIRIAEFSKMIILSICSGSFWISRLTAKALLLELDAT